MRIGYTTYPVPGLSPLARLPVVGHAWPSLSARTHRQRPTFPFSQPSCLADALCLTILSTVGYSKPMPCLFTRCRYDFSMTKGPGRTYRYYQGKPVFPFGAGLSYTTFKLECNGVGS
jgi:hypothetical protein